MRELRDEVGRRNEGRKGSNKEGIHEVNRKERKEMTALKGF